MKLTNIFIIFPFLIVATAISAFAVPYATLQKRDSTIANYFVTINGLISQLDQAQQAAGQSGTPDFSKASGFLVQLAQTAEAADSALVGLGSGKLDANSAGSIKQSLQSSASSVRSITSLIQKGKEWFAKNNATQKVIQILQSNLDQFHQLFIDLNAHTPSNFVESYKAPEKRFICAIVDAIATLDKSQISSSAVDYCNGGGDGGTSENGLDAFNDGITPTGYESCGNSPTMFFEKAYTSKTLGTGKTQCTSGQTAIPNSFGFPSNPLLL